MGNRLGDRLRQAREAKELSQPQLARLSGVAQSTIADMERGRIKRGTRVPHLAAALGVDAGWLAGVDEGRASPKEELAHALEKLSDKDAVEALKFLSKLRQSS